jgi:hypothetical protein
MEKTFKALKKITVDESNKYISAKKDTKNNFITFYTLEPSNDLKYPHSEGWEDVEYYTGRLKPKIKLVGEGFKTDEGYIQMGEGPNTVYIMSNPSYKNLHKIGSTRKSIEERRKELSAPSGVPTPFNIEWIIKIEGNEEQLEREIHKHLDNKRSNINREFFEVSLIQAVEAVMSIAKNYV